MKVKYKKKTRKNKEGEIHRDRKNERGQWKKGRRKEGEGEKVGGMEEGRRKETLTLTPKTIIKILFCDVSRLVIHHHLMILLRKCQLDFIT